MNDEMKRFVQMDIDTVEEIPLTDIQKQKIRKNARIKKVPNRKWNKLLTAAVVSLVVIFGSVYALPTIASQLPFVENILEKIDPNFVPKNYEDLATIINQVESSNGIDMMIENAVYDGTTLMVTYAIHSDKDLGEQPMTGTMLDIKGAIVATGTSSLDKSANGLYTGLSSVTPKFNKNMDVLQIKWQPKTITNPETNETFEGDWSFAFTMDALPSKSEQLTTTITDDNAQIQIHTVDYTDLSTVIHYEYNIDPAIMKKYPLSSIHIVKAVDTFGNEYDIHDNGGMISKEGHGFNWSFALYDLPEDVSTITLTAELSYVAQSGVITSDMSELLEPIIVKLER
ncbi:hypothetical protein DCE79_07970 [Lysinibacillus sp. 2017]|uniref:DUF4179 domain-containing protein n=1 Tax=unclassified Lysinibacillus TaxID=2636778 RepID=UPI000D526A69|nr:MULTISPECIES: DUF4179 domain-containing protein [unclassified Lysinibacillus]AWE07315.1 hypothetical protein DCE79_07970 [Lysinibacillus sp. 2017]TGN32059.1 DUF4179 domain-containing protein [Lysinibacillus sp. S2017]